MPTGDPFNLARYLLEENVRERPGKVALVSLSSNQRREFTYAEIAALVAHGARFLHEQGARPGERILLRLRNGPEYAFAFFAGIAAGLVAVPASPQLTAEEAGYLATNSEARWIIADGTLLAPENPPDDARTLDVTDLLNPSVANRVLNADKDESPFHANDMPFAPTGAEDPAFLIYTSGTTGFPRGVLHAQRAILGRRPMGPGWTGLGPEDRLLHAGQLNWTYTMGVGVMDPFSYGATAILCAGDSPTPDRWLQIIAAERATIFAAVPGLYRRILKYSVNEAGGLKDKPDISSLRHGLTAGEALRPELYHAWRNATGTDLFEALGMSEVSTYISSGPVTPVRLGSPGRPQPGRRIAVLPRTQADGVEGKAEAEAEPSAENVPGASGVTGLLAVHRSDPGLMLGYWRDEDADERTRRGEWFIGGDVVAQDADGYIYYQGRDDEMMNSFGYRVSPLEVERVLSEDGAVQDVAVAEKEVSAEVSLIAAYVVPAGGAPPNETTRSQILERAGQRLAAYKRPRELVFVESLPRNANGKLMRRRLG